jgi:tetratricopeptide (TPR) repeat protein
MRRTALLGVGFAAAGIVCVAIWWSLRDEPPPAGPLPVPEGQTTRQTFPDSEGNPEVWTLAWREASREELAEAALPAPAPRESSPGEMTDSARTLDARALQAWQQGELRDAIELFEAAVEADPEDWLPRADYGRLLLLMTDYERARTHLERAAQLAPEKPRVWLDLLSFYERTVVVERAFEARQRAEEAAGGRALARHESTGLWVLEGESIFP